ncbi:MAG TPA: outer membrane beta-barrel protein [Terriglobales bacterium]|nr:outer membrane beta-barrel protein [Terriglobales bacterium]
MTCKPGLRVPHFFVNARLPFTIGALATLFLFLAGIAQAQLPGDTDKGRIEVTPFVGYESGASAPAPNAFDANGNPISNITSVGVDKSYTYGAWLDYAKTHNFSFEFMYMRNPTTYTNYDVTVNQSFDAYNASINLFQFGILYHFLGSDTFRPYLAAGLGFNHESDSNGAGNTAFAFNIGGGVKYYLGDHFGLRGDFRLIPQYANSTAGQVCDPYYGCYYGNQHNFFKRVNVAGGIILRF